MRYSVKTLLAAMTLVAFAVVAVLWLASPRKYTANILSRTSLRTDAPPGVLAAVRQDVYENLRLRHFMDGAGRVTFADGSASDATASETASVSGDVTGGRKEFDDPNGNKIALIWTTEPGHGTLLQWEYQGKDPQDISVAVQQAFESHGVEVH
ncbi:hypothetical protein Pla175_38970 [Pirellulimonas nuda]|uniref:Uncharacterized protein n=1 Tax=Pirellulimonas nuda TaxID=2528009 RepID=A0A518DGC8_9BACT|nr:hypothetical protein [Pirellulimonas nuda]QDU90492.1 hypothetical protein Pla175_38970 [Pirellulimonas nuda]